MGKLALTGGGRCNISNDFSSVKSLEEVYPRGSVLMKRGLKRFGVEQTLEWFAGRGVRFVTEDGGRIFPASQDAMQIVRTLLRATEGARYEFGRRLDTLPDSGVTVLATGGGPGMKILDSIPVVVSEPVPSLFGLDLSKTEGVNLTPLAGLEGISCEAALSIPGTKFRSEGSLLITRSGLSGPAALRLSSYAARYLAENSYSSPLTIRWFTGDEAALRSQLSAFLKGNPQKHVGRLHPEGIAQRLWEYLLLESGIALERTWAELGSKSLNRLVQTLLAWPCRICGKTRYSEEFVTCGGVSLQSVDLNTLECKERPGLYFAGEILDVDAVTGGFNLQAAWTTAAIAANSIIAKYDTQNL